MRRATAALILFFISFLTAGSPCLFAQEKVKAREQAQQHYLQGKELYSQGRYQEATGEFEKAAAAISPPRIEFIENVQKEAQKSVSPAAAKPAPLSRKKTTETEEKTEKKKEKKGTEAAKPAPEPPPLPEEGEREYYIDVGDILDISVWQVPDLSRGEVIVRPDGKVSFPLIGDIKAEGTTLTQLDNIITEKLKEFVRTPEVSIMIRSFGEDTNKVIILGEIVSPGIYKFNEPPTITEAVAAAGGYTKYAVLNSIMVIRGGTRTKPTVNRVNLAQILKTGKLTENIFLKPNDIVYAPRSFIGNVNTFLDVFQPAMGVYMQQLNARHLHHVVRKKGGI